MTKGRILHIVSAEAVGEHRLHVVFDDLTEKTVDLASMLTGPVFEPLQDPAYFARVTVDPVCRTVVWPNGADLAPEALWGLPDLGVERKAS